MSGVTIDRLHKPTVFKSLGEAETLAKSLNDDTSDDWRYEAVAGNVHGGFGYHVAVSSPDPDNPGVGWIFEGYL